jgi:hypothetical protein
MTISFDCDQVKVTVWRRVRIRDRERFPSFPAAFPIFPPRRQPRPDVGGGSLTAGTSGLASKHELPLPDLQPFRIRDHEPGIFMPESFTASVPGVKLEKPQAQKEGVCGARIAW